MKLIRISKHLQNIFNDGELDQKSTVSKMETVQNEGGRLVIEAPLACIEYVVTHEFTHFLQPNHSKKFYKQLAMFMPDWLERKKILERNNCFVE